FIEGHGHGAALEDQIAGRVEDPLAGRHPPGCGGFPLDGGGLGLVHYGQHSADIGLDSPLLPHRLDYIVQYGLRPRTEERTVMTTAETGALQQQLEQINAQIPEPIAERITTAIAEVDASGVASGWAPGQRAPEFSLPDAMERPVSLKERLSGGP